MPEREVDVVVIGMGPGGEDAAERLAAAGLAVAGVESRLVGGECPYYGCVPSKMMIRAANLLAEGRRIPGLAGRAQVQPDWAPVARPDPGGGHRRLGRPGRRGPVHRQGRPVLPRARPDHRPRAW